jgi:hypothetical protein
MKNLFDPTLHNFKKLPKKYHHKEITFYERDFGREMVEFDPCRTNVFLSQSQEFVTVWFGFFEPLFVEGKFSLPEGVDVHTMYQEPLFRGYIRSVANGAIILDALDLNWRVPSVLKERDGKLVCEQL